MKKILTIAAVLLIGGISAVIFSSPSDTLPRLLSGADFVSAYQETADAVLLDVRTPSEFMGGHLSGAKNVDFNGPNFLREIQKLDKEKPYFVYCRSGNRSGQAVAMMQREGFRNIHELQGGIVSNQSTLELTP